jgi:peptidoglycan/xylan/chitin deacetylase (PgdA/CDA1 family)
VRGVRSVDTCALLFHDVIAAGDAASSGFSSPDADIYKLPIDIFEMHLNAIAKNSPAPLVAAPSLIAGQPSSRSTLITFDDGGASGFLYVADMLEARGWLGHFLITTDYIGAPAFMSAAQLRNLRKRGHIIGSHSVSHPTRISSCAPSELDRQWGDSVERLANLLGESVEVASVPGGYYTRRVAVSAARAGIRLLFNSEPVTRTHLVDGCLVAGRFGVQQGVPPSWTAAIVRGDVLPRALRYLHWNGKKVLKIVGGDLWIRTRRRILAAKR